jgi:energy-coupling factor transport system permease protein
VSLEFLNGFKFIKKNTIIHDLDPRVKLLFAIIYTINALLFTEIVPLLFIFLTLIPIIVAGKLVKLWVKSVRGLSLLIVLIILLNTLFISLNFAIAMVLRILLMISAFSVFFLTVDPNDLALSLMKMKVSYEFAFSFSLAFRFVPTIAIEAQNIMDAQQSRGYELQQKGLLNQIKNLFPLLIPLIICSIRRAYNVAEALESRAFGSNRKRSFYFTIYFKHKDWIFSIFLIMILLILIFLRLNSSILPSWIFWSIPL